MLFALFNAVSNWSALDAGSLIFLIICLLLAVLCFYFLPQLMRLILIPLLAFDILFMTPGHACNGARAFKRVPGTENACTSTAYDQFLNLNFGVDKWYIILTYSLIVLFILFKLERIPSRLREHKDGLESIRKQQDYDLQRKADEIRNVEIRKMVDDL